MICLPVKQSDQKLGLFMKTINNLHEILKEHNKKKNMHKCILLQLLHSKNRSSDTLTIYLQTDIKTHPSVYSGSPQGRYEYTLHSLSNLPLLLKSLNTTDTTDGQLKCSLWRLYSVTGLHVFLITCITHRHFYKYCLTEKSTWIRIKVQFMKWR